MRALIKQAWDQNDHTIKLFLQIKKQLTILAKMKNAVPYSEEDFVEALYMAVQKQSNAKKRASSGRKSQLVIVQPSPKQERNSKMCMRSSMNNMIHSMKWEWPTMPSCRINWTS